MKVQHVLVDRWILVDDQGIRRSTWYQTPQDAQKALEEGVNEEPK